MFYLFSQNNSGGSFIINEAVGQYVIVEADSHEKANRIAEMFGIYFDGCERGEDCNCCGDRWYRQYSEEGDEEPKIYGKTIEEYKKDPAYSIGKEMCIHIYYKNGEHEKIVFDAKKAVEKKKAEKRKQANKLWGNYFSIVGAIRNKKPIRFYENISEWSGSSTYYDMSGNLSIEKGIDFDKDFGWISFSSVNKKEVEDFMAGAKELMEIVYQAIEEAPKPAGKKGEGMDTLAKLFQKSKR
jgi:hypothetical protein